MTHHVASVQTERGFAYRALRADGSVARGAIAARDRDAALAELSAQGLFPLQVEPTRATATAWTRRMSAADLALGLRMLATLVDAGLPLRRVAQTFATVAPASWAPVVSSLGEGLRAGRGLTAVLASTTVPIPPIVIGIVRAGEAGGGLAPSLRAAAELSEQSAATRAAIRGALAYPAVLALAGLGSTFVLVGIVLPRFAAILADLGQALPPTTRIVLRVASLGRSAALPVVAAIVVVVGLLQLWRRSAGAEERWCAMLLALPILGPLRHSAASARASAALSALLGSGVPLPGALTHAAAAAGDGAVEARLLRARSAVLGGRALAAAIAHERALTETTARLVRAGEESGQLATLLGHAARF